MQQKAWSGVPARGVAWDFPDMGSDEESVFVVDSPLTLYVAWQRVSWIRSARGGEACTLVHAIMQNLQLTYLFSYEILVMRRFQAAKKY